MNGLQLARALATPRTAAIIFSGMIAGFCINPASAQYEVREWANFEDGKVPTNALVVGGNANERLTVVPTASVTGVSPAFKNSEVGTHVLQLKAAPNQADPSTYQIGLIIGDVLDRSKLGENGRAMFQADFYFEGATVPSLAVLATEPPKNVEGNKVRSISSSFYRFGMTKNTQIYYSQFRPGEKNASVYEFDKAFLSQIPSPGWHRFALVCEGPSTIRCYVDGRETPFSPITDASMKEIQVGLLLADSERTYTAYADNLSIQVSDEAPALPASPYDEKWNVAAGASQRAKTAGASTALPTANVTTALASEWLPPGQAWAKAKQEGKGMLLYFYAPGVSRVERINELLASDPAAKAYIAKHACARVDVNQLEGGSIAKKYGIFKVPTFLVISPDAKSYKKVTPAQSDNWAKIEQQLGGI